MGILQQEPNRTSNGNAEQKHGTAMELKIQDDDEEIITLEVGRHHESLDQHTSQTK